MSDPTPALHRTASRHGSVSLNIQYLFSLIPRVTSPSVPICVRSASLTKLD